MSMFPHTVTIYTPTVSTDPLTMKDTVSNEITVIHGALMAPANGAAYRQEGKNAADTVKLYIPMDAEGSNGLEMIPGRSFFIKGDVQEPAKTFEQLNAEYRHVYRINTVNTYDFGGLPNWEVGGN